MKKVFVIDGGAGRIITAIPALEKYVKQNPSHQTNIIIYGWDNLLWGNQLLQDITYNADTKGIFDLVIKDCDIIVTPEPYRVPDYFNQKLSLSQAFNVEINQTSNHNDIGIPSLYTSKAEEKAAASLITEIRQQQKKQKTIVIQPFGRGARVDRGDIIDDSSRGLDSSVFLKLAKKLSSKYNLILFAEKNFFLQDDIYTFKPETDLRNWIAIIDACDYFIGCDSVGQHIARARNKPGTVIMGSTFPINSSYPDWFNIWEKPGAIRKYSPIRLAGIDTHLADRFNDNVLNLSDQDVDNLFFSIANDIKKYSS